MVATYPTSDEREDGQADFAEDDFAEDQPG
jgi:hypothetical protein